MKTYFQNNDIDTERFIRNLKNKMYKYMNSVSKNVYIDKWNDIVHKYNNTYHSTITMKPVGVESNTYVDSSKEIIDKDPNLKLVKLLEHQKIKIFLQKLILQISQKKILWLKMLKILCRGYMFLNAQSQVSGNFWQLLFIPP